MKYRLLGTLCVLFVVAFGIIWLFPARSSRVAAQQAPAKCLLPAPDGYPDHTNCPECIKDDADKREKASAAGVITKDVSKNDSYVQPPVVLGGGHALKVDLTAPGDIVSVTRGCYGLAGC